MSAKIREASEWQCISEQDMRAFIVRAMRKMNVSDAHAQIQADVLLAADSRGVYSHGLNKLGQFLLEIE